MPKKKHDGLHQYERRRLGTWKKTGQEVYKCALPNCTHYIMEPEFVIGKYSRCWGLLPDGDPCPNEVEMTRYLVMNEKRKHPYCEDCKRERKIYRQEQQQENERLMKEDKLKTPEQRAIEAALAKEREKAIDRLMAGLKRKEEEDATID